MKRFYACLAIFAVIFGVTVWSSYLMHDLSGQLNDQLDEVTASAEAEQWGKAEQAATSAQAILRDKQTLLAYFIAHSQLSELDTTLSSLPAYARDASSDIMAETERARSQVRALSLLFFRTL